MSKLWAVALPVLLLTAGHPATAADPPLLRNLREAPFVLAVPGGNASACGITTQNVVPEPVMRTLVEGGFGVPVPSMAGGLAAIRYFLTVRDEVLLAGNVCIGRVGLSLQMSQRVTMPHLQAEVPLQVPLYEVGTFLLAPRDGFPERRAAALQDLAKAFLQAWKQANQP